MGSTIRKERVGTFRTDGQGIRKTASEEKRPAEAKKLNPNSAAARRRKAAQKPTTTNSSSSMPRASESNVFNQSFDDDLFGNDPFQTGSGHGDEVVRNPLTFESFGNEYSHDDGFDFVSDNGSGFDTFASSDDGSRSTGAGFGKSASDIALMKSVMKSKDAPYFSEKSRSDQFMNDLSLDFTTFGLNDTEGEQGEVRTKRKKSGRKNTYETSEI